MAYFLWTISFGKNHWYYFHLPIGPFHLPITFICLLVLFMSFSFHIFLERKLFHLFFIKENFVCKKDFVLLQSLTLIVLNILAPQLWFKNRTFVLKLNFRAINLSHKLVAKTYMGAHSSCNIICWWWLLDWLVA